MNVLIQEHTDPLRHDVIIDGVVVAGLSYQDALCLVVKRAIEAEDTVTELYGLGESLNWNAYMWYIARQWAQAQVET